MNLTPPSQNSHAVRWHWTAESERIIIFIFTDVLCSRLHRNRGVLCLYAIFSTTNETICRHCHSSSELSDRWRAQLPMAELYSFFRWRAEVIGHPLPTTGSLLSKARTKAYIKASWQVFEIPGAKDVLKRRQDKFILRYITISIVNGFCNKCGQ